MFQKIIPRDKAHWLELRKPVITSTEVAALFGISPYLTPYELFYRKRDQMDIEFEPNERVTWGLRLEHAIASGIAEDNDWSIRRMDEFIFDPELKLGSSFDYEAFLGDTSVGLLEIKNVDALVFRDGWILDGDHMEGPPHIEIQIQNELLVSGHKQVHLCALVGGNKVVLIRRDRDEDVISALKNRVEMFWKSIRDNVEPKPDFERDAKFIASLYRYSEPGKVITATKEITEIAASYKAAGNEAKEWEAKKQAAKARILTLIGDAEKVIGEGFSISAGIIGPCEVKYTREGYRDFRINVKKIKEDSK